jgi:hypothetical protein
MANLLQPPDSLDPPEDLRHPFVFPLIDHLAGTPIDGTATISAIVLGHVRSHALLVEGSHQVAGVVVLIPSQRQPRCILQCFFIICRAAMSLPRPEPRSLLTVAIGADTKAASRSNLLRHSAIWADDAFPVGLE